MKNTILKQTELDILSANNNFKTPTVHGAFGKAALWVIYAVRRPITFFNIKAKEFDANVSTPPKYADATATDFKDSLANIQDSISDSSKTVAKLEKDLAKAQDKLTKKTGKKMVKAKRKILDIINSLADEKKVIGQNQALHSQISKKLAKKGLLHD